jgi:hypothetical protein
VKSPDWAKPLAIVSLAIGLSSALAGFLPLPLPSLRAVHAVFCAVLAVSAVAWAAPRWRAHLGSLRSRAGWIALVGSLALAVGLLVFARGGMPGEGMPGGAPEGEMGGPAGEGGGPGGPGGGPGGP